MTSATTRQPPKGVTLHARARPVHESSRSRRNTASTPPLEYLLVRSSGSFSRFRQKMQLQRFDNNRKTVFTNLKEENASHTPSLLYLLLRYHNVLSYHLGPKVARLAMTSTLAAMRRRCVFLRVDQSSPHRLIDLLTLKRFATRCSSLWCFFQRPIHNGRHGVFGVVTYCYSVKNQ